MAESFIENLVEGVLEVTLNRPERLNALSAASRAELAELWQAVRGNRRVRCVILTGTGRAFCAGADAGDMAIGVRPPGDTGYRAAVDFCPGEWLEVPIIVAVNGLCVGAGLSFVADADLLLASEGSWFSDPHTSVGQVSAMEPLLLAPKVAYGALARLVMLGSAYRMSPAEALASGLIHEVVPAAELMSRARAVAATIASQSPAAMIESLRILRRHTRSLVADELDDAWSVVHRHFSHPDATEGPLAFVEKRAPRWADPPAS